MSHEIPTIAFPVEFSLVVSGMDSDGALALAPAALWLSTSRNWWYQGLLHEVLQVYPGFSELGYLLEHLALVKPDQVLARAAQLRELLHTIQAQPQAFCQLGYVDETPESLPDRMAEAQVSRHFDDDSQLAFANFFSFLTSQAAALEEAGASGKALLYVQPQPWPSPQRLCLE